MTLRTLAWNSVRRHWRLHLGVLLGAALGSAILIGALIVGDSVRVSLRNSGLERLGPFHLALSSGDRFYRTQLFTPLEPQHTLAGHLPPNTTPPPNQIELTQPHVSLLQISGGVTRQDKSARVNQVQIFGMPSEGLFRRPAASTAVDGRPDAMADALWEARTQPPLGHVLLNDELAGRLKAKPGDELVFRLQKPSALSQDAVIAPRDETSIALRLKVHAVISGKEGGNLSLRPSQIPPANAFVRREDLDAVLGLEGRANLTLMPTWSLRASTPWMTRLQDWMLALLNGRRTSFPVMSDPGVVEVPGSTQSTLLNQAIGHLWELPDAELTLRPVPPGAGGSLELATRRIFLDDAIVDAATTPFRTNRWRPNTSLANSNLVSQGSPLLTYLVNEIRAGSNATPYSMVTAALPPWVPTDLADDEIVINEWLASDLHLQTGSTLDLSYYLLDTGSQLMERTNHFRVRRVVPIAGLHADRTLMPEFPGLAKAESTRDWDAGFPLTHKLRDKDEAYWKEYRGTPKAFVSLRSGQRMWSNKFGRATAIRYTAAGDVTTNALQDLVAATLLSNLNPAAAGLRFEPVREQALLAADQSQDFGGLFIGFSFFLILAALALMSMLFQFGAEERQQEVGVLLAIGFTPKRVRKLLLREAILLAGIGAAIGLIGALAYSQAMVWGLGTLWRDAVGTSSLRWHATPATLFIGWILAVGVCAASMAWTLRKQAARAPRELLQKSPEMETSGIKSRRPWIATATAAITLLAALGIVVATLLSPKANRAPAFFGAGALLLVGGLSALNAAMIRIARRTPAAGFSRSHFVLRSMTRRRSRSLTSAGLLASGSFLVFAMGANRLDSSINAGERPSGTGGFTLLAESSIPIVRDLNTRVGQEALGLDPKQMAQISVVPFRVKAGDDASCLNLNRAQQPRLLGVNPELLATRGAFQFAGAAPGYDIRDGWKLLTKPPTNGAPVPVIGDAASIQWAMHQGLGDLLIFTDERGQEFKVQLIAGLANSVMQGQLVMDEREFQKRYPSAAGAQWFLIDCPVAQSATVAEHLSKTLQNFGFETQTATERLARFNAIQNTYLNTFQLLGGLGLILGSVGLGVVLLRNALERRSELATQQALGFSPQTIGRMMLQEHLILLMLGLGVGLVSAVVSILPQILGSTQDVPWILLSGLLTGMVAFGALATVAATRWSLRGRLIENLRAE